MIIVSLKLLCICDAKVFLLCMNSMILNRNYWTYNRRLLDISLTIKAKQKRMRTTLSTFAYLFLFVLNCYSDNYILKMKPRQRMYFRMLLKSLLLFIICICMFMNKKRTIFLFKNPFNQRIYSIYIFNNKIHRILI